jgi:hypothetical protein
VIILTIAIALWASVSVADNNRATKDCLAAHGYSLDKFDTFDWSKAAACASDYRVKQNSAQLAEMRDFLKHNPRYRVPGQSLNRCWGKPREMPFKSAYIRADKNGFEAGVSYKDKLPAGCYENAPWDNRDAER